MDKLITFILMVSFCAVSAGCTTMKVVSIEDHPIPTNGKSNVIIYSPKFVPHAGLMVDGVDMGRVLPPNPLYFQVDAGMHVMHTSSAPLFTIIDRELTFNFKPNTNNYFKLEQELGAWASSNWLRPTDKTRIV